MKKILDNWSKYLTESHSKKHEEQLEDIVKELEKASEMHANQSKQLEKASQMHASQAERIQKILDETDDEELEEALDLKRIAAMEDQYVKLGGKGGPAASIFQQLTKLSKMGKYDMKRLRNKMKAVKEGKKNCGCGQDPCKTYGVQDEGVELDEKKKKKKKKKKKSKGKKDACYHKVKARYDVWPSAYASGALVKCRKVGAKNWGNKSKKNENQEFEDLLVQIVTEELVDLLEKKKKKKKKRKGGKKDGKGASDPGYTLRDWFKNGGWVQTGGAHDGKPCAKQPGQKTKPYCRDPDDRAKLSKKDRNKRAAKKRREDPNPNRKGKAKNVSQKKKRKSKKESIEMITTQQLTEIILDELSDNVYYHITDATYDDGSLAEDVEFWDDVIEEAEYRGRKVKLNKPTRGDVKKFKVYVKNAKGNVVKVNFGDKKMRIKKSNPKRRKSFRARHNCDNPGPKWKARYWSCRKW